jgi:hypothetical protein
MNILIDNYLNVIQHNNILNEGCKSGSKGYKSAQTAKRKYGHGKRRVPKVKLY